MKPLTFDTVRTIGLELAGVEESTSYGTPALKVRGQLFARLKEDRETLVVRTDRDARDELIAAEPDTYYLTDHYLNHPWVLVHLSRVHPDALRDLLHTAWQLASPTGKSGAVRNLEAPERDRCVKRGAPAASRRPRRRSQGRARR